jgi:membrane protease YdiL (CAAX protease family)
MQISKFAAKHPLVVFVVINYAISWTFLPPAYKILLAAKGSFPPLALFGLIGGYSPSIAALIMLGFSDGWNGVKSGLRKFLEWRAHIGWYLFVLVLPVLADGAAVLVNMHSSINIRGGLLAIPVCFLIALPFGPMGEELGWRGYFLPQLLERYSVKTSTLIVGCVWTVWHLASFMFPGAAIPSFFKVGAWSIFLFFCTIMAESFICTYAYLKTRGSLVVAIALHMAFNAGPNIAGEFFPALDSASAPKERIYITQILIVALWALGCFVFDRTIKIRSTRKTGVMA